MAVIHVIKADQTVTIDDSDLEAWTKRGFKPVTDKKAVEELVEKRKQEIQADAELRAKASEKDTALRKMIREEIAQALTDMGVRAPAPSK